LQNEGADHLSKLQIFNHLGDLGIYWYYSSVAPLPAQAQLRVAHVQHQSPTALIEELCL
jgi:hypothetical protein